MSEKPILDEQPPQTRQRREYTMAELLAQSDYTEARSPEERE